MQKENNVKIVDLKFTDLPGMWQHFSLMAGELSEDIFEEGCGFDGSSIRGFQAINESDMLLFPDPTTAIIDPVCKVPTLSITCNIKDPITLESYTRDVRYIAQKAEAYLQSTGIADISYWVQRQNSIFLTISATARTNILVSTMLIPLREVGIQVAKKIQTSATNRATKKGISQYHLPIHFKTYAPRFVSSSLKRVLM